MDLLQTLAAILLAFLRLLLTLADWISLRPMLWVCGWAVCRLLTFGRLPRLRHDAWDRDQVGGSPNILIPLVGLTSLAVLAALLATIAK